MGRDDKRRGRFDLFGLPSGVDEPALPNRGRRDEEEEYWLCLRCIFEEVQVRVCVRCEEENGKRCVSLRSLKITVFGACLH